MESSTRHTPPSRPRWARRFVEEPVHQKAVDDYRATGSPWKVLALAGLSLFGLVFSLVEYIKRRSATELSSIIIWTVGILALVALRPRTCSLILIALYIAGIFSQAINLAHPADQYGFDFTWSVLSLSSALFSLIVVLNMPLRHPVLSRAGISQPFTPPTSELRSPEDDLTMWQWMTVSWMAPLIDLGTKRQLNNDDVWLLAYEFQHTHLHEAFRHLSGSVIRRLIKAHWMDLALLTLLALVELAANYSAPVILQKLLQAMNWIELNKRPAITWGLLTLLVEFVAAQSSVFSLWFSRRAYERSRGEMITMLHEKVLNRQILGGKPTDSTEKEGNGHAVLPLAERSLPDSGDRVPADEVGLLGGAKRKPRGLLAATKASISNLTSFLPFRKLDSLPVEKEPASMGKILNLMRNDVYQVSQRFWEFQMLINTPVGLILSLVLVWRLVGWASLIGIGVIIIAQLINAVLARILFSWEKTRRRATDNKLQQITQYVQAIRHLRWYGWHGRKLEKVLSARQKELNLNIITFAWSNAIMFVNTFASCILPVAAFWAYTALAGQKLSVDVAFPALQLFTLLQTNLRDIPNVIKMLLDASVSLGRIEDFMIEADVKPESTSEHADHLELENASFAWPGLRQNVLHKLNVVFPPGLSVVVGPVASGKTALLEALLGELDLRGGRLIRPDIPIGYCAQTPWLESMTIRDNILFCSSYEETRYKLVLEACSLLTDLASFKQGDLSPIGENGIGLSGGQKARVALARAFYSRAKILLLDDPLSALDQQTAEWIVSRCFSGGLMKDRTVVLVTHRTDLCLHISKQVVEMVDGQARVYKDTTVLSESELHLSKVDSPPEQVKRAYESAAIREKFEDEEHRRHGGVQLRVYWEYVKAGKLRWWAPVLLSAIFWRLLDYAQSWFLKEWGEAYKSSQLRLDLVLQTLLIPSNQSSPISRLFDRFPDPGVDPHPWLFWFMMLAIFQAVAFLISQVLMMVVTYTAGKNMFKRIMVKISNATFLFYDVTPVGRLMNRLTGDVSTVDGPISSQFLNVAWEMVAWVSSVVVIASVTPPFLVFSIGLTAAFVYIFLRFLPTSQSLRRLEMVSLSPLMSNFGALLTGLMTVRAFHAQAQFQDRVIRVTDAFQKMDHFYWSLQSWLQYRFDSLSAISTFLLTLLAIYSGLSPGMTAFVLIAAQRFVQSTHRLCKQYGKLQLDFVSVERVVELLHLDQEGPGSFPPPAYWPSLSSNHPAVQFEDITIRYAPHLDPALRNISFSIPAGSSTAVIGRTGSGKSTLALSLLATIEPDAGRILVDGIDISKVSKQDLRSRVTFLAQEPILFEGTLRTNLDPMDDYLDSECLSVVHRIHGDARYQWNLDTRIDAGGKNLSQGQRQLVGLARAILRRSAIIILDEATASVDLETSWEVQRVLKEELAGSTVITIAHRASAVRDCDFVVKLDNGNLVAFGRPEEVETGLERIKETVRNGGSDAHSAESSVGLKDMSTDTGSHEAIHTGATQHMAEGGSERVAKDKDLELRSETATYESIQHGKDSERIDSTGMHGSLEGLAVVEGYRNTTQFQVSSTYDGAEVQSSIELGQGATSHEAIETSESTGHDGDARDEENNDTTGKININTFDDDMVIF